MASYEMDIKPAGNVQETPRSPGGTSQEHPKDEIEIARFGKKQRFNRRFRTISIIGLVCTLMATWETILIVLPQSLTNGGPQGAVFGFLFAWGGVFLQVLVLAELASMMPLAGGEYNWVAVLAPPSCKKFLSYITGWITVIAWQGAMAGAVYLTGQIVQALAVLNHPSFSPTRWQLTLMFLAILAVAFFVNTFLARLLPSIESAILLLHILGFFGILIPLVYLGPKGNAHDVFGVFINGGWSTDGLSFMVGSAVSMLVFAGVDGATHLAEEIENSSTVIPRAMIASVLINGASGFALLLAALFCAGDLSAAIDSPTGQPFLAIFAQAVGSNGGATGMAIIILITILFTTMGYIAATSRMLWAFARERGVPFHRYITKISGTNPLPLVAIVVSTIINACLALINIGSSAAFNAFTSLTVSAYYISFAISAGCLLYRKITGMPIRYGPFTLGKAEIPLIIVSMAYSIVGAFFSFWPQKPNPEPSTMNWASVIAGGTLFIAMIYWFAKARKTYTGPIIEVSLDMDRYIRDLEPKVNT